MGLIDLAVAAGLVACNVVALPVADYFGALIFLDTLGTAIAGLAFGPVAGFLIGLITNVAIGAFPKFRAYWKFIYVNALCGLAWGFVPRMYPVVSDSEQHIILYILAVGGVVGAISTVLSVPLRCYLGFATDHLLDQVDRQIYKIPPTAPTVRGWTWLKWPELLEVFSAEFLLGHLLDKTVSTTVAVMLVLYSSKSTAGSLDLKAIYHDLVEFLGAYYYVALGFSIRTLRLSLSPEPVVALLGPLAFFGNYQVDVVNLVCYSSKCVTGRQKTSTGISPRRGRKEGEVWNEKVSMVQPMR